MGFTSLLVGIGLAVSAAPPELVILPPAPEGVSEKAALKAWKAVAKQFKSKKARKRIGYSLKVQKEAYDVLAGPGQQQAWDCGTNATCLADLGDALGANLVVAGTIGKKRISLAIFDVATKKKVIGVRSSKKLAKKSASRKAKSAARGLLKAYGRKLKKMKKAMAAKAGAVAAADAPKDPPPPPDGAPPPDVPPPDAPPPPDIRPTGINGLIRVPAKELEGVVSLTVDGVPLARREDGSMIWMGSPGSHTVTAKKADGSRSSEELTVAPQQALDVTLTFTAAPPTFFAATAEEEEAMSKPATSTWWFWTSIGVAVLAGGATSVALLGGSSGGPDSPSNFGAISGGY